MGKFKLHWAIQPSDKLGNAYGYAQHNRNLRKHVEKIADISEDAENALIILSPEYYTHRLEGKINWLFTMFEGHILPEIHANNIKQADYILVPSTWAKSVLEPYFDKDRIFVVPHGVTPDFKFKQRLYPADRPFRYLWVGAANPRKGWEELVATWSTFFIDKPDMELYIKTTKLEGINQKYNVILDGRNLSKKELIELYHSAHCFVFPSRGEGFALTAAEAVATGLPIIATNYSGHLDFLDETIAYMIDYEFNLSIVRFPKDENGKERNFNTITAFPKVEQVVKRMLEVKRHYAEALQKGKKGSELIHNNFTWERSAEILVKTMQEHSEYPKSKPIIKPKVKHSKVITMTCWKRPEYTKRVIDGLRECKGVKDYILLPRVEPKDQEVRRLIKDIDFMDCRPVFNAERRGINDNTFRALKKGFEYSDFVIHLEDDTIPAKDMLTFFEQTKKKYEADRKVFTVCAYNRYPQDVISKEDYFKLLREEWFTPWAWATWRNRWEEEILPFWNYNTQWSWDVYTNMVLRRTKFEVRPVVARVQNIGAKEGEYCPDEEWHQKNQFNKIWAGDVKIPVGKFTEA